MSNDFFNGPSRLSYLLKLALAALTMLALIVAWYARSGAVEQSATLNASNSTLTQSVSDLEAKLKSTEIELDTLRDTNKVLESSNLSVVAELDNTKSSLAANTENMATLTASLSAAEAAGGKVAELDQLLIERDETVASYSPKWLSYQKN